MPVQKRSRVASFALSALTSALIGTVILPAAHAAGLGKLTVLSALGQPLRAEIELTAVAPAEAADLAAKLAPAEAFSAANIDFNPALLNLRFDIDRRDGRQFIRVTSTQPINEPFVDMLLELTWANGRLVREYTFLLDPAEMRSAQAPQVAAPVDVSRATAQAGARATAPAAAPAATPAAPAPQAAARPVEPRRAEPAPAPAPAEPARDDVRVKRGDTLSGIAQDLRPANVSLDMMLVALYRANPEAFSGNNMNRLKSGTILSVPSADTVRGLGRSQSREVVVAHAADFNAYRAKLAGQVASSTPARAPEAQQSTGGKITAKVEERPNAVNAAQDQLKLSKAGEISGSTAGKTGQTGSAEDKIAKDQQVADAAARVKELEKNVSDLENLMAVKSKDGTEAQNRAATPELDTKGAPVPAAPQPVAQGTGVNAPADKPKPAARPPAPAPAKVEPGIMDTVMDNIQAIGIALAVLLAGVGLILSRRRKAKEAFVVKEDPVVPGAATAAPSLYADAGGQSVDTSNSVFNSNFAPSASQLDTNEVDPVAEADVYIAYGRDAQAEEILKEALRTHPERHAVRLKLLEIYANRKDLRAFEAQAAELHALSQGQGDEWTQAATLGRSIDPTNPLYAAGASGAGAFAAAAVATGVTAVAADEAARASEFAAALDGAARARDEQDAATGGLDLDLDSEPAPAPEAQVNALDFDFGDATALPAADTTDTTDAAADTPAEAAAETATPAPAENLMDFDFGDPVEPDATAQPPAPSVAQQAEEAEADKYLDFDLGGLSFEPAAGDKPPVAAQAADDSLDLAFDEPATAPAPAAAPAPAGLAMDFDLDLPGEERAEPAPASAPAADPLAELDLMDFDRPQDRPASEPSLALDDDADLPELPAADTPAPAPLPDFDLSGIDLDLDEERAHDPDATATPQAADEPAADEPMSAHHMEMDTKLDLAIAYQEIGDKEGARELLDEVIRGGSDRQVERANQMLALLA